MRNSLVAVIDSLLRFANKHAKGLLDPSAFLTQDQIAELTALDAELYAGCQLHGISLSVIPEPQETSFRSFGNSKLPYVFSTLHLPIKDEDGKVRRETRPSGMMIFPTSEWTHALKSLRMAAAALRAKAQDSQEKWIPANEAVEKANQRGFKINVTWLTRDAAKRGVKVRPRQLPGNHKQEVEWNSLAGYLLEHRKLAQPAEEQEDPAHIQQRILSAQQQRRKERPLD
ncbi:MAG TPA: hypothetical protein VG099_17190 [Gemmataceae bacterium]|jgi:hypothetical protein|nr:hypothetical protein [Gemmataceae bacterium]